MLKLWRRVRSAMSLRSLSAKESCPPPKSETGDIEMDPYAHSTGIRRRQMLAEDAGKDPFYINMVKRGPGTKENPTLIPSAFERRLVGCLCLHDRSAKYIWLEKGCPKRCECGHWFKIKEVDPL